MVARHLVDKPVFVLVPLPLELTLFQQAVLGYPPQHPRPCQILADTNKEVMASLEGFPLGTNYGGREMGLWFVVACLGLYINFSISH